MKQKYSVVLSFGSFVYLGGLMGLLGGFTYGILGLGYYLYIGGMPWWSYPITPIMTSVTYCFVGIIAAATAFPLYRKVVYNGAASHLSGHFTPLPEEE